MHGGKEAIVFIGWSKIYEMDPLWISALVIFALNAGGFVYGYLRQSDKLTDLMYSLSFALAAVVMLFYSGPGNRTAAYLSLMILIWAARLGGYLFMRIHAMDRDTRFDEMRPNAWRLASFWILQAVTVWVVILPLTLVLKNSDSSALFADLNWFGGLIWIFGLGIESLADWQKFRFRNNPANKGQFMQSGLWKWARHPNYLGEILVWIGFYLVALPSLGSFWPLALISPLWIALLLIRVSGIPLLERSADKRYGMQHAYQEYKKNTARLIPFVW